jgi:hypothetical protein
MSFVLLVHRTKIAYKDFCGHISADADCTYNFLQPQDTCDICSTGRLSNISLGIFEPMR